MLTIIFAAALLPSVLGSCCHPNQMSGQLFSKDAAVDFVVDLAKGKYYTSPINSTNQFTLVDLNTQEKYTQSTSGCVKSAALGSDLFERCIPSTAMNLGSDYIGPKSAGVTTTGYQFTVGTATYSVTVANAQCFPIFVISQTIGMAADTFLFVGVSTSPTNLALLDADISSCISQNVIG